MPGRADGGIEQVRSEGTPAAVRFPFFFPLFISFLPFFLGLFRRRAGRGGGEMEEPLFF